MRYIKQYESFEVNQNKEYFKDKIDWKLFQFLEDICTKYNDDGFASLISIYTIDGDPHGDYDEQNVYNAVSDNYESELDDIEVGYSDAMSWVNKENYDMNKTLLYSIYLSNKDIDKTNVCLNEIYQTLVGHKYSPKLIDNIIYIFMKDGKTIK